MTVLTWWRPVDGVGNIILYSNTDGNLYTIDPSNNIAGIPSNLNGKINLGTGTTYSGTDSIAIGNSSTASNTNAIAIGKNSAAPGASTIAIGLSATVTNNTSNIAIGPSAQVTATSATGKNVNLSVGGIIAGTSNNCTVIGSGNITDSIYSVAIGIGDNTTTFGVQSSSTSGAVAIGYLAKVAVGGVAIGASASAGIFCLAFGSSCVASGNSSIAFGNNSFATGAGSLALGTAATASATNSIACGYAFATGTDSVACGYGARASAAASFAFGNSVVNSRPGAWARGVGSTPPFQGADSWSNGLQQIIQTLMICQTTNATQTELATGDGTNAAINPTGIIQTSNNSSYYYTGKLVAKTSPTYTDTACWDFKFLFARGASAGSCVIVGGTPTITQAFATAGAISGSWALAITADTTNGRPAIKVTGQASTTINWSASIHITVCRF